MSGAAGGKLVTSLIDRLTARLPYRTGIDDADLDRDDLFKLTRATLTEASKSDISVTIAGLTSVLDELSTVWQSPADDVLVRRGSRREQKAGPIRSRANHILQSELYVVELLADCCRAHWNSIRDAENANGSGPPSHAPSSPDEHPESATAASLRSNSDLSGITLEVGTVPLLLDSAGGRKRGAENSHSVVPQSLPDSQVMHLLNTLTYIVTPVVDAYQVPNASYRDLGVLGGPRGAGGIQNGDGKLYAGDRSLGRLDRSAFQIMEYLSASNWSLVFNHIQSKLKTLRALPVNPNSGNGVSADVMTDPEANALAGLQVMAHLWINRRKLSAVVQELRGCFLNLQKTAQIAIAVLLPETIGQWLDNNPDEFVQLHTSDERLDGGAEFLFDMSNTMATDARLKEFLWPFQTSLVLLIPEVFWIAGNMKDANKGNLAKKAAFLSGLRQSLRSSRSSNTAAFCLVGICRVAHHFPVDSDAALLSYALDVQLEVREEVFKPAPSDDERTFDLRLMTAAVVSLSHLNLDSILQHLVPWCFDNESMLQVKLAVFHSCAIMARQPDAERYDLLFAAVGPHCRDFLLQRSGQAGAAQRGRRSSTSHLTPAQMYELLCTMFEFLAIRPSVLFENAPADPAAYNEYFSEGLLVFVAYLADDDERVRNLAARIVRSAVAESLTTWTSRDRDSGSDRFLLHQWWRSTSVLLTTLAKRTLDLSLGGSEVKTLIHAIDDYLRTRLDVLKIHKKMGITLDVGMDIAERSSASVDVEEAFLVLLCSSDLGVCAAARSSLALFCEEGALTEDLADLSRSPLTILRNYEVYRELSSPDFHLTGLVAFQKRYRRLLVKMTRPTAGMLLAWEIVFSRWNFVCTQILTAKTDPRADPRADPRTEIDETTLMEWRNYSGFLASLGGSCIADTPQAVDIVMTAGLRWIDRLPADGTGETLLDGFMTRCLQLLSSPNVRAREAIRDVLGTELCPRLYSQLFRSLEAELSTIFDGPADVSTLDSRIVFAEQVASLLRAIFERLDDVQEALESADFGLLALDLARYLHGLKHDLATLRVKIKICQLCEAVTCKREALKIGHDVRVRNQLLSILLAWMSRPGLPRVDESHLPAGVRLDAAVRVQRDLDRACLRALVDLTYGLPLQPPEGQSDADTSESKSALYQDYFGRFLSLLDNEGTGPDRRTDTVHGSIGPDDASTTAELAIMALSNLLSANIDVGLKQSLEIGYHQKTFVRTAFLRVLCNILNQEVEFERLSDSAMSEKYNSLIELLLGDVGLAVALCESCPSSDVDEITISLLNIFESRGMGITLLRALIEQEVMNTENETQVLRRNSVATKMLSAYAKWKGSAYLKSTLQQVLRRLIQSSEQVNLELDPIRTSSPEDLQRNALQLKYITKVFIDDICKSTDKVPLIFRRICNVIASVVTTRFPDAKYTAVGAFVFLRFFCPAIVAPETEGLVGTTPTKDMRRGLLLIAKVVQNLANNALFGNKESYMFPLNPFLAQHIWRVTAYLRVISAPVTGVETEPALESFDFGSCVALHRFLFDHWDAVRQKILVRERRSWKETAPSAEPAPSQLTRTSPADALGSLVAHLGAPSLDISWNRPQISTNMPPTYSRFQNFMLKNAGRNSESVTSARAVYDGGQSKDELPVICIILRNIEQEGVDNDLLLYCYLKIASRLWHRPFGVLIDATCYNSLGEPQDELFQNLDALTPSELCKNLTKVYVYNMNSAFRKCFRRILRLAGKNEHSSFHPSNVEYHLIGSLHDLQLHFHLGPLHLPKNTITVVNDSRYVFQPVVRLSRTRGKVDVVIKLGTQFVQITTVKKQDIVPGLRLSATVNDIFRLADVDEANPSAQADDRTSFGLRTENGKIVMHFTSARKDDILQAIKTAKSQHSKDAKPTKSSERLIRPEDVPGTLINIALMSLASSDKALRLTSHNLLCSLCRAFHFGVSEQFVSANDLDIPSTSPAVTVGISQRLAVSEPHLTSDFLSEFFLAWDKAPHLNRPLHILFMIPWLSNLRKHVLSPDNDSEKGRERVGLIARKLIDIMLHEPSLRLHFQHSVWPVIASDEMLVDIFLDEMIKNALLPGYGTERSNAISSIAAALGTVIVQGKVIARLRKNLNRSSLRPTRYLASNAVWSEICVLLHICVATSFDSRAQAQLFLPELFHIITSVVNTGSAAVRLLVHSLLVNTVHSICVSFPLDDARGAKLKSTLTRLSHPKVKALFTSYPVGDSQFGGEPQDLDNATFSSLQEIAQLMLDVITSGAPSTNIANMWRSRWMSLVASTAFQSNPAIQPRAFAVMGCLAREDVDDDLLYQVLVSLRTAVNGFGDDRDRELLIAIVTTLTRMMAKLPSTSRYVLQLFWLAMSLVRLSPLGLFDCAASFLEAVLQAIAASGRFKDGKMTSVLLQGRGAVGEAAEEIDALYGVKFGQENFHFATSACLVKGLTDPVTKETALRTLSSFLEIASASLPEDRRFPKDMAILPYLGLVAARATTVDESREILWLTGLSPNIGLKSPADVFAMIDLNRVADAELSLHIVLSIVDFASCEDIVQQRTLIFLHRVALQRPIMLLHLYEPLIAVLDGIVSSSETSETLEAAHNLIRSLVLDSRFAATSKSSRKTSDVLEEVGMGGIWKTSSFRTTSNQQKRCAALVGKLIEHVIL
ncbi:MAG: Ras GTPase activating protein ira2 [Thelocarpon impressellum]|nr:MAG: Ras GTPase activating protein ira2 [Thelocarpon impressellum]